MAKERTKEVVTYKGASAVVWPRGDGRWAVSWTVAGKGKSSTFSLKEKALAKARQVTRDIVAGLGTRPVSIAESEVLQVLYRVAGDRSPLALLAEVEEALQALKGTPLRRAVAHWIASGMADVVRISVKAARDRFLDGYDDHASDTYVTLQKEIDAFIRSPQGQIDVCDLELDVLKPWVLRKGISGEAMASRTINNRLAVWVTFLNACRNWGYLPKGEKHVAELIPKEDEPDMMVPIWEPKVAKAVLGCVWKHRPNRVPFIAIGCWLGLRPTEIGRLRWELFDWKRGYLFVDISVAQKVNRERYVPLNPTVRAMLEKWLRDKGWWEAALSGKLTGKVGSARDSQGCSELVREHKVITTWEPDVMRHSWISYMIAQGHSKADIAEWAGNSEAIIKQDYRRPLMREDGDAWFAIKAPASHQQRAH